LSRIILEDKDGKVVGVVGWDPMLSSYFWQHHTGRWDEENGQEEVIIGGAGPDHILHVDDLEKDMPEPLRPHMVAATKILLVQFQDTNR